MTRIYYFSGSGHSLAVSRVLSEMLGCEIMEIGSGEESISADTAVVVFPVYCQNIPSPVIKFLRKIQAKHIALIATYGRISYGNVLYEAQEIVHSTVIAGAYIPMGHTFLNGDFAFDKAYLLPIADRIRSPKKVYIPKMQKNIFSNAFPALRSRIGVKLTKSDLCTNCGLCTKLCPMGAIQNGQIRSTCIRCLRCVTNCPQKAMQYKNSWVLHKYLSRYNKDEYVLYL